MKKYDIVVARYNEDLSWLDGFDKEKYNIVIYNKGEDNITYDAIKVPNVGRDAGSFVRYIVDHYDNMPEFVVFVQGDPMLHCHFFGEALGSHIDLKFVPLADDYCLESVEGWYEKCIALPAGFPITNLHVYASALLGDNAPKYVFFGAGQQFLVHRDIIRRRSLEFYKDMLASFETDYLLPWHVERLWLYIWNIGYVLPPIEKLGVVHGAIEWISSTF